MLNPVAELVPFTGEAVGVVQHALHRLWSSDRHHDFRRGSSWFDHDTAEGRNSQNSATRQCLIPIDERLIFHINYSDHRVLQTTILIDFNLLQ